MSDQSGDRCGYIWPTDDELAFDPSHQSCCFRETVPDADRCPWHIHTDDTEHKTIDRLKTARAPPEVRAQNEPIGELLDGAVLTGIEIGDTLSLSRAALRAADFSEADLEGADLSEAILPGADLSDAILPEADLSEADLKNADLSEADLKNADLSEADLKNVDLSEADLKNADLTGARATVIGADLSDAFLENADLSDADLPSADLSEADLDNADLSGADLDNADFSDADLSNTNLTGARIFNTDLTDAQLTHAQFNYTIPNDDEILPENIIPRAELSNSDLSEADLSDADLRDADLSDADLPYVGLSDADLSDAYLPRADLSDADLSDADFPYADLSDAYLSEADLPRADLSDAYLSDADLQWADLSDADLLEADLREADLEGAELHRADLREATLTSSDCEETEFDDAVLNRASLENADLVRAQFPDAHLFGTRVTGAQIDSQTQFALDAPVGDLNTSNLCRYDSEMISGAAVQAIIENDDEVKNKQESAEVIRARRARSTYRRLEELARQNGFPDFQSEMFIRRQDARRELLFAKGDRVKAAFAQLQKWLFNYGESFRRIFGISAFAILLAWGLYMTTGIVEDGAGDAIVLRSVINEPILVYNTLLHSVSVFFTGNQVLGASSPVGQGIIIVESMVGPILVALLIFVLGRRAAR